jgi:hypothetical protein
MFLACVNTRSCRSPSGLSVTQSVTNVKCPQQREHLKVFVFTDRFLASSFRLYNEEDDEAVRRQMENCTRTMRG